MVEDHVFAYQPAGRLQALAVGTDATASPDGALVVYVHDGALWTVDANGSGARRIAALDGEVWPGNPIAWSADNRHVAVPLLTGRTELVDLETGATAHVQAVGAALSPDGMRVAYADVDGLQVAAADGSRPRLLAAGLYVSGGALAWSPDGQWIAVCATLADGHAQVVVVHPDGSDLHGLAVAGNPAFVTWSRDGRLAWVGARIQVAEPNRPVRTLARVPGLGWPEPAPAWSRDGRVVAVRTVHSGIALVPTTGHGKVRVLRPPAPAEGIRGGVSWAGSRFVFTGYGATSDTELVRADGTGLRALTNNAVADRDPDWSPDGRSIAFVRFGSRRNGVYAIDVASKRVQRLTVGATARPHTPPTAGASRSFAVRRSACSISERTRRVDSRRRASRRGNCPGRPTAGRSSSAPRTGCNVSTWRRACSKPSRQEAMPSGPSSPRMRGRSPSSPIATSATTAIRTRGVSS
jgi:dipeptidyl aminopeptidase/acylaminoacyl peptidase